MSKKLNICASSTPTKGITMITYYVVTEDTVENLITEVNRLLKTGWELQGGVSVSISESDDFYSSEYSQALIKQE